jgi:gliding motility-associated-like protein
MNMRSLSILLLLCLFSINTFGKSTSVNTPDSPPKVYIPNAFSPNGDGVNDVFKIETGDVILYEFNMKVFNRWGTLMFESDDYSRGWNGRFKNNILQPDVFIYAIEYKDGDGLVYRKTGSINLLY